METRHDHESQLCALSLLATLRTAAAVCQAISLRRAGVDPSAQEDEGSVRAHLLEAEERLRELAVRLRLSLLVEDRVETALVRAFEVRSVLAQAARLLHLVHQRLLSLYPEVDERLVEAARMMQAEAARLGAASDDGACDGLVAWCDAALGFAAALRSALYTAK